MATIINADTSDGLKLTSDTSGQIDFQSAGSTKALIDTSGNLKFNSGYGSVVTAYGIRAWINFDGTDTVSIRDSGNVSSLTDNGTGLYTVNFATNMPDINYSFSIGTCIITSAHVGQFAVTPLVVSSIQVMTNRNTSGGLLDMSQVSVVITR